MLAWRYSAQHTRLLRWNLRRLRIVGRLVVALLCKLLWGLLLRLRLCVMFRRLRRLLQHMRRQVVIHRLPADIVTRDAQLRRILRLLLHIGAASVTHSA